MKSSKPILFGGIILSVGLWMLKNLHLSPFPLEDFSVLTVIVFGGGLWLLQKKGKISTSPVSLSCLTQADIDEAITQAQKALQILEKEAKNEDLTMFKTALHQLSRLEIKDELNINIIGGKYAGKTSLKLLLETQLHQKLNWHEINEQEANHCPEKSQNYDLILFLITGDLTDSQWQIIQQLNKLHHRVILLFNKADRYLPEEKVLIRQQIHARVKNMIPETEILTIATVPQPIKVKQYQADGNIKEWMEAQSPQIDDLVIYLQGILNHEIEELKLRKIWRNVFFFQQEIKDKINQIRKEQSLPLIEKYQWIAAGATFANPISSLDLLATAAINGQLLIDLSEIYQQRFSLDQAQNIATVMGKLMIQLGLVELSTQTISSLLKTNAITYLAGSTIQGISAAYLTRIAGLSLIEYYQEQELISDQETAFNIEKLGEKIKQVFQQNQRGDFLKSFVQQASLNL